MKLFPLSKKGQGVSLTVIIVAAIALLVMIVLIMIFTGRIGLFEEKLGDEADADLKGIQTFYGQCQPSIGEELAFKAKYAEVGTVDSATEKEKIKQEAKAELQDEASRCKSVGVSKDDCDSAGCRWTG